MYKKYIYLLAACLISLSCWASKPLFQATYALSTYENLDSSNISFRVTGDILDSSMLGYSSYDIQLNDYVFCETPWNDIDRYVVTNIVSVLGVTVICDIRYDEEGSPIWGAPGMGYQIICRGTDLGALYVPSLTYSFVSEYLQNGVRNQIAELAVRKVAGKWSLYPAISDINLSNAGLTNAKSITLGGIYRTNWPAGSINATWEESNFNFVSVTGGTNLFISFSTNGIVGPQGIQGTQGIQGVVGPTGTAATIGIAWVSNSAPGESAYVTNVGNSNFANLGFILPQGSNGPVGTQGIQGIQGATGTAATIAIAWVSNSAPGASAYVTNVGSSNFASFGFILPQGSNGPTGSQGIQGLTGTAATISIAWTSNSAPGESAYVTNTGNSNFASFGFILPQGSNGPIGPQGIQGLTGSNDGLAATIIVKWTSNGPPGSAAFVTNVGNSNAAEFGFIIPQGSNGITGIQGTQGIQGVQGVTGETGAAATIAVAWTSNSTPGSAAFVTNVGNSNAAEFGFILPQGSNGLAATIEIAWASNSPVGSVAIVTNLGNSNAASLGFILPIGSNGPVGPMGPIGPEGGSSNNWITLKLGDTETETNKIYQLQIDNTWVKVNNMAITNCNRLLGIALGSNSTIDGILFQGVYELADANFIVGAPIYVDSVAGNWTQTIPTNTGYIVRQVGHAETTNKICLTPNGAYVVVGDYFDLDYNYVFNIGTTQTFDTAAARKIIFNGEGRTNWPVTSGGDAWSQYPATQTVNVANKGLTNVSDITLGGERRTNWPIAANYWSLYPALQLVDLNNNGLTNVSNISLGGVNKTAWPNAGEQWSVYPATQTVDIANKGLTNVANMTLGGVLRSNWPSPGIKATWSEDAFNFVSVTDGTNLTITFSTNGIVGPPGASAVARKGTAIGGALTNNVVFSTAVTNIPKVILTWYDTTIDQVAIPIVIQKSVTNFKWQIRTSAGISTNAWQVDWVAVE